MSTDPPAYPPEIANALLADIPPVMLLAWLDTQPHGRIIFRGFQQTPKGLKMAPVRKRFLDTLHNHADVMQSLVDCWKAGNKDLLEKVHALSDKKLRVQLSKLQESHGTRAVHLALMLDGRENISEKVLSQDKKKETAAQNSSKKAAKKSAKISAKENAYIQHIAELETQLNAKNELLQEVENKLRETSAEKVTAIAYAAEEQQKADVHIRALQRDLKREQSRAAKAEELLAESKRRADRNERRAKKLQRGQEDVELEIKRLRRQVRQQQQISEDLRKQLAAVTPPVSASPDEEIDAAKVLSSASKTNAAHKTITQPRKITDPADRPFFFKIAGCNLHVSLRQIAAAASRNDEELISRLTIALFELREANPDWHRQFIQSVRAFDRYSARILTGDTTRVLVDASNVARYEKNKYGKGILNNLLALRDELRGQSFFPIIIIADASLPHYIDEPHKFREMVRDGAIQITNKGEEADEYLARQSQRTGAYVVTNDVHFHMKATPNFEPLRIGFSVSQGIVFLHEF